jgi:hypothetical protein
MHPPSLVEFALEIPERAVFQTGLGLDPQAWDEPQSDGARFVVEIDAADGWHTLLDATLRPHDNPDDRGWRYTLVDLGAYAGRSVTLRLRTEGLDTPYFDWAAWATPMVYSDASARYPPPATLAPAVHGRA